VKKFALISGTDEGNREGQGVKRPLLWQPSCNGKVVFA